MEKKEERKEEILYGIYVVPLKKEDFDKYLTLAITKRPELEHDPDAKTDVIIQAMTRAVEHLSRSLNADGLIFIVSFEKPDVLMLKPIGNVLRLVRLSLKQFEPDSFLIDTVDSFMRALEVITRAFKGDTVGG